LEDITVFRMPADRGIGAIPRPDVPAWAFGAGHGEDQALACLLITQWTLVTGRTLRTDVPLHMLSGEELISFWADERMTRDCPARASSNFPDQVCALASTRPATRNFTAALTAWRRAS
jgi:hypothetical protein